MSNNKLLKSDILIPVWMILHFGAEAINHILVLQYLVYMNKISKNKIYVLGNWMFKKSTQNMVRQLGISQDAIYTSIRKWTEFGFIEKNKFNFSSTAHTDAYGDGDNYYIVNDEAIQAYGKNIINELKNSPKENIPNDIDTSFCIFNPVDNMVVGRDPRKAIIYRAIKDMRVSGYTVTTSLLMTRTGFGERAARKALKELSKFNFITVESRVSKRTFTRVNELGKVYIPRIEYFVYNVTSKFVKIRQHFEALWEDFINFGLKAFTHTYRLLVVL